LAVKLSAMKEGDITFIEWEDSYGCSARWEDILHEGEPEALICKSVGWVTRKSKRFIVIVPHMAENGYLGVKQGCGDMAIPVAAIFRLKVLKFNA